MKRRHHRLRTMSNTPKRRTQSHGGKRPGSGRPAGRKNKRRRLSFYTTKQPTSQRKKESMRKNKDNKQWDKLLEDNISTKKEVKELKSQIQDMEEQLGQYMDREDINKLLHNFKVFESKEESKYVQFHLILQLLYKSRLTYNNLHETVVATWSILRNQSREKTLQQLASDSTMKRWGRYMANFYFKFLTALYAIITVPDTDIMYKNDGTDRNKDNLYGHVLEFKFAEERRQAFGKCEIDGEAVDITHFAAYDRSDKISRLVINYNESIGKSADSIKECTEEALNDINYYIQLWGSGHLKQQLIETFGEENLNFTPINERMTGFGHDRHIVKYLSLHEVYTLFLCCFLVCCCPKGQRKIIQIVQERYYAIIKIQCQLHQTRQRECSSRG